MRALVCTSFVLAFALVAVPRLVADDAVRLEQQCTKEMSKAADLLKKVQEGQLTHAKALEQVAETRALLDEFAAADPKGAEPMIVELQSIEFWIKKMAPLFGPEEKEAEQPRRDPQPKPDPEPPQPDPQPDPTPDPTPEQPAPKQWVEPVLPDEFAERTPFLKALLSDADPKNRAWAAGMVPKAPGRALVDRLFELLLGDADESVGLAAQDGLIRTRHSRVLDGLVDNVDEAKDEGLGLLFGILEARPDPRSVEALFQIVMDNEEPLASVNERSKTLMDQYRGQVEAAFKEGWRARVMAVFKTWPGSTVVDGIVNYAKDHNGRGRQEALLTLGLYGDGRGANYAATFLTKSDNAFRATALATVEMIGKPAVPYLAGGLGSDATKLWCLQALINITGQRLGQRPQDWVAWWRMNR